MENKYDLEKELQRLHRNFQAKLALKMQSLPIEGVSVSGAETHIEDQAIGSTGIKKWLRIFNILSKQ